MPEASSLREPDFVALRINVSRLRNERAWTYDELTGRTGIDRSTLYRIETGAVRPDRDDAVTYGSLVTWYRIAEASDMTLGELLAPLQPHRSPTID